MLTKLTLYYKLLIWKEFERLELCFLRIAHFKIKETHKFTLLLNVHCSLTSTKNCSCVLVSPFRCSFQFRISIGKSVHIDPLFHGFHSWLCSIDNTLHGLFYSKRQFSLQNFPDWLIISMQDLQLALKLFNSFPSQFLCPFCFRFNDVDVLK